MCGGLGAGGNVAPDFTSKSTCGEGRIGPLCDGSGASLSVGGRSLAQGPTFACLGGLCQALTLDGLGSRTVEGRSKLVDAKHAAPSNHDRYYHRTIPLSVPRCLMLVRDNRRAFKECICHRDPNSTEPVPPDRLITDHRVTGVALHAAKSQLWPSQKKGI